MDCINWTITIPSEDGYIPCPALLDEDEVIRLLRLDKQKADPHKTIQNLRAKGVLPITHIGKNSYYSIFTVLDCIKKQTGTNRGSNLSAAETMRQNRKK